MAAISTNKFLFFLFFSFLIAAHSAISAQRLPNPEAIIIDDGLCFRLVNSVVQDKNGLMWFCTANGLSRYDSYRFVSFGKESSKDQIVVYRLIADFPGQLSYFHYLLPRLMAIDDLHYFGSKILNANTWPDEAPVK